MDPALDDGASQTGVLPSTLPAMDLFDLAPVGMAVLDSDMRCVRCNIVLAHSVGSTPEGIFGKTVRELIPDMADEAEAVYRRVFDTGEPVHNVRLERVSRRGRRTSWLQNVVPLPTTEGGDSLIMVTVQEVTQSDATEQTLLEIQELLHTYQTISTDGFALMRALRDEQGQVVDFIWEFSNPAAERMANVGPLVGNRMTELMPATRDHPSLLLRYVKLLENNESDVAETYYDEPRTRGWFLNHATPLDTDRLAVCWRDITARKESEEELKLVSQEYRHRIKNLLTIVSSLISHAGRSSQDAEALAETMQRQIQALAAAQDLISHTPRIPVDLEELVTRALRPFMEMELYITGGPKVALPQRHAIPIVLALNELATNALKHGGLSVRGGSTAIGWDETGKTVSIRWSEKLDPESSPVGNGSSARGFGSRLFKMVERSLPGGKVELEWRPQGLLATISFDDDGDSG